VKKVLYDHADYYCTITSDCDFSENKTKYGYKITHSKNDQVNNLKIELKSENWQILWPNREGEIFSSSQVIEAISKYQTSEGLSISYPATASCRTIIFMEKNGRGFAFLAPPDNEGRVTEFRISAEDYQNVAINIKGKNTTWYTLPFVTVKELRDKVKNLKGSVPWTGLDIVETNSSWQIQVGLIGPDGKTGVPDNRGFNVLADISELMLKKLGKDNILHIFGYSMGHDIGYPDYTPSSQFGGASQLKKAIEVIHLNRQKAVFYINGRIAQKENVEKDGLFDSVLKDNKNLPFTEIYHNRNFYIMNPSSKEWQERLFLEASKLKALGADGIQLDQLGGRSAPVPPGEIWGKGYIDLINNIHKEGLSVWIQGLSDIYPADWFELTYRNINVLKDGTIRGGTPFGKPDKRVFQISAPDQILLIPFSKADTGQDFKNKKIIIDLDNSMGKLFLYNPQYLIQLKKLMHRAGFN